MLLTVAIASLSLVFPACVVKAGLGEEFSISTGQTVIISGEDLEITFVEVTADNRCARDVVCITAGEVVCLVGINDGDSSYSIELAQPGLYFDYAEESFGGYKYRFKVEPYPESDKIISSDEYRILLIVTR
jgi:hypothetical protein